MSLRLTPKALAEAAKTQLAPMSYDMSVTHRPVRLEEVEMRPAPTADETVREDAYRFHYYVDSRAQSGS